MHPRQGGQQGAVFEFELVGKVDEPGIAPRGGNFAGELEEHLFEQFGVENSLCFGETTQTYLASCKRPFARA